MASDQDTANARAALRDAIADRSITAAGMDSDALADHLAQVATQPPVTDDVEGAADAHASAPEATDGNEHADDAAGEATARDIASGKVIEPQEGGVVEPVDG